MEVGPEYMDPERHDHRNHLLEGNMKSNITRIILGSWSARRYYESTDESG